MITTDTIFTEREVQSFTIPEAPAIPGLSFRSFRGDSDFPKMVAVIAGSKVADRIERVDTPEQVANQYQHLINSDPYQDVLIAEVDGQVIGYSRVAWREEREGNLIFLHFGFLLPAWRRMGIGRAMLRQNQRHLRQIAAANPSPFPRYFESFCMDTEQGTEALLLSEGYSAIRHEFIMVRPDLENIPAAPLPEGLEVRPVEPYHWQAIVDANNEAFRDHWGYSDATRIQLEEMTASPNFNPSLWKVAWAGDQVAGMVMTFIDERENAEYNRKRGWTEGIGVRRPWRRMGVARALIAESLRMLKELGMNEAALGVDTQNPNGALQLYESMGYQPVQRQTIYRKPLVE